MAGFLTSPTMVFTVVQSGDTQFMLVKTQQTPKAYEVDGAFVQKDLEDTYGAYRDYGMTMQKASQGMVLVAAKTYGLAYYQGSKGNFRRVYP